MQGASSSEYFNIRYTSVNVNVVAASIGQELKPSHSSRSKGILLLAHTIFKRERLVIYTLENILEEYDKHFAGYYIVALLTENPA